MPFTTVAHSEAHSTTLTLTKLTGVTDNHVRVSGDDVYIPAFNNLVAVYAIGDGLGRAQLDSPSLRDFVKLDIHPVTDASTTSAIPKVQVKATNPVVLATNEGLNASVTMTEDPGSLRQNVFTFLSDGAIAPVSGEIHTVRFTATNVTDEYTWADSTLTFDQTLPVGRYQIVGMEIYGKNLIFARLVPVGSFWRPGIPGSTATSTEEMTAFRNGNFGVFCEFDQLTPPSLELFASADTDDVVGFMDLIKL